jgi:hypothetical protein
MSLCATTSVVGVLVGRRVEVAVEVRLTRLLQASHTSLARLLHAYHWGGGWRWQWRFQWLPGHTRLTHLFTRLFTRLLHASYTPRTGGSGCRGHKRRDGGGGGSRDEDEDDEEKRRKTIQESKSLTRLLHASYTPLTRLLQHGSDTPVTRLSQVKRFKSASQTRSATFSSANICRIGMQCASASITRR